MKLSDAHRQILADFYGSDTYKIIRKHFIEEERLEIAKRALTTDPRDVVQLATLQGQASALKQIHQELKQISRKQES